MKQSIYLFIVVIVAALTTLSIRKSHAGTYLDPVDVSTTTSGVKYRVYENVDFGADLRNDYSLFQHLAEGTTNNFDINVSTFTYAHAIIFWGYIDIPSDDIYAFYLHSIHKSELYIDGLITLSNNTTTGFWTSANEISTYIGLKSGKHEIVVMYANQAVELPTTTEGNLGAEGYHLSVSYSRANVTKQLVPDSVLSYSSYDMFENIPISSMTLTSSVSLIQEDSSTSFQYKFRRDQTADDLKVFFKLTGTAIEGTDYIISPSSSAYFADISNNNVYSIIISSGDTTANMDVTPVDNTDVEANKTIVCTILGGAHYNIDGTTSRYKDDEFPVTVTILEDDIDKLGARTGKVTIIGGANGYIDPKKGETAMIALTPAESGEVEIKIYSIRGMLSWEATESVTAQINTIVSWDGRDMNNYVVASGIYICYVEGAGIKEHAKIAVIK